jgi:hypothetical protein
MLEEIGQAAGAVWNALAQAKQATIAELRKKTGLTADQVNRAIGWLAREDKLLGEQKGKTVRFSIKG